MSKLKLGLDTQKVFGEFLPTVFINKVILNHDLNPLESTATTDLFIGASLEISFSKNPEFVLSTDNWISAALDELYLYALLSPYPALNTALQNSQLSLKDLYVAMNMPGVSADTITSSWSGFNYIINMLKEAFINDWYNDSYAQGRTDGVDWTDEHRATYIEEPSSEVAHAFWGTWGPPEWIRPNLEGPWSDTQWPGASSTGSEADGFVNRWLDRTLQYVRPSEDDEAALGNRVSQISLRDLLADGTARIIEEGTYDRNGFEISRLIDIEVSFRYHADFFSHVGETMTSPALNHTEKLFLVCFVGRDASQLTHLKHNLFNANFGDISYEHLLEHGYIPDREENVYVEIESEEVFNGRPIQTINKKYYVPTPVNQGTIVKNLETLIVNFRKWSEKDKKLAKHIENLQALLAKKGTATDLLSELALYGSSYPNKDLGSTAGKFYNAFTQIVGSFNRSTAQQLQLAKKLVYNDRILDLRPKPQKASYYAPVPDPEGAVIDEDFIPYTWSNMSRYAEQTIPRVGLLSDFLEFAIGERYTTPWTIPELEGASGFDEQTYDNWLDFTRASAESDWESMDESWMYEASSQQTRTWSDTVVGNKGVFYFDWTKAFHLRSLLSHVINPRKLQELFRWTVPYEYYFATRATVSRRETLLELQQDPGTGPDPVYTNPGDSKDNGVNIILSTTLWDSPYRDTAATDAADSGYPSFPVSYSTSYQYDPDNLKYGQPYVFSLAHSANAPWTPSINDSALGAEYTLSGGEIDMSFFNMPESYDMFFDQTPRFGGPSAGGTSDWAPVPGPSESILDYVVWMDESFSGAVEARTNSFLFFQNFDVLNPTFYSRLEGYGDYALQTWDLGRGPRDGYRIMAFEYRDYMDDDVAYYNTNGSFMGDRNQDWANELATASESDWRGDWDDVWTRYYFHVYTVDRSLAFLHTFYDYLMSVYNDLEAYYNRSNQICSYNNIYGRFNDFFIEGIYELYGETVKPWIKAAYVFNACRDLFFTTFSAHHHVDGLDMEALLEDCRLIINDIGPENGSLAGILAFKNRFRKLLNLIYPEDPDVGGQGYILQHATSLSSEYLDYYIDGTGATAIEAWDSLRDSYVESGFANNWKIDKFIYGNLALGAFWDDALPDYVPPGCHELGQDADMYPKVKDRIHNWLACLTEEYKGPLRDWCEQSLDSGGGGGGVEGGSSDGDTLGLPLDWDHDGDRDADDRAIEAKRADISTTGWDMVSDTEKYGGKKSHGINDENLPRAWQRAIMAAAFIKEWGDHLEGKETSVPGDWYLDYSGAAPDDVAPFMNKYALKAVLSKAPFQLDSISPFEGFNATLEDRVDYYGASFGAAGGWSWAEIIAQGVHELSKWGCNPAARKPFAQNIPIQVSGHGTEVYYAGEGTDGYGDSSLPYQVGSYDTTEELWAAARAGHEDEFLQWYISATASSFSGGSEEAAESLWEALNDPENVMGDWTREMGHGVLGYWNDVEDYDFYCTGYVDWGERIMSESSLHGLVDKEGSGWHGGTHTSTSGSGRGFDNWTLERCYFLISGPSQGATYRTNTGHFYADGSACVPD